MYKPNCRYGCSEHKNVGWKMSRGFWR